MESSDKKLMQIYKGAKELWLEWKAERRFKEARSQSNLKSNNDDY
jgi:hypothetical protein